jgi:hypothetical protein
MTKKVEVDAVWLQQMVNTLEQALESEQLATQVHYTQVVLDEIEEKKPPIEEIELPDS